MATKESRIIGGNIKGEFSPFLKLDYNSLSYTIDFS